MLVSPEHRFVLHKIWEEKCLKQAEPFLMWLKVACTKVEVPVRKQPKLRLSGCLLEVALCDNQTTGVLFIKEVRTHSGHIYFTSEGGVEWVG